MINVLWGLWGVIEGVWQGRVGLEESFIGEN